MSIINGIHHVSMKCYTQNEYERVVDFYHNILELPIARTWKDGIMFAVGDNLIEVFTNGQGETQRGIIRHVAFATTDVEACVAKVKDAGYEVFLGPKDIQIPSEPVFEAKMAFCYGPLGEEIEFFEEK